jgi:Cu/Ag efflux protein CusF
MESKLLFFGIVFLVSSGCAAYQLQPLGMNHPANAQAMAAPERPGSKTLAYSRPAVSFTAAQQGAHESHYPAGETDAQKTVVGEGKVIATVPNASQLVVEHGELKGFMDAMTMGYRVEPSSLIEGLKSGEQIRFTIDVPNKTIIKIEKIK